MTQRRPVLTAVLAIVILSCGAQGGGQPSTALKTAGQAVLPTSPPPAGGPVPVQLRGAWSMVDGYAPGQKLTLTQGSWKFIQASGSVVMNGDEMDLFNSPGCIENLGYDAVGRYRWTLESGLLRFSALNADPCERISIFNGSSFRLVKPLS